MELVVTTTGHVLCIYDDAVDLARLGRVRIERASHVEPNALGRWLADLAPVGGPLLGPFDKRADALAAEHEWLVENWLCKPR
ncbi:MAG: hypothetical protein KDA41_20940 [Planctomycetales bacterium]|nr:hypothetical protein [Planctomycetales bacterium]